MTKAMTATEKFQIESKEAGYTIVAHDSPLLDNRFLVKNKDPDAGKIDVQIQYIQLDSLLTENGE